MTERERESSVGFCGSPNNGRCYSHTTPIRIPKDMGIVNGKLTIRGGPKIWFIFVSQNCLEGSDLELGWASKIHS